MPSNVENGRGGAWIAPTSGITLNAQPLAFSGLRPPP
jgi:hypothetical protein